MAFTVTPIFACSTAQVRIMATIAPFDAEYAVWPKLARCPAGEPTRISRPPSPCSRNRAAAARPQVNVPRRWLVTTRSKSSSVVLRSVLSRSAPALVIITSSRPNSETARATSASAISDPPTAPTSATALPPASTIDFTVSSATSASRSLTTTDAPAAASARA